MSEVWRRARGAVRRPRGKLRAATHSHRHRRLKGMDRRAFFVASTALVAACRSRAPREEADHAEESHMTKEQRAALGALDDVPAKHRRAFGARGFRPLPAPGPDDWLAVHPEPGQTFDDFVGGAPNVPDADRGTLCMLPLGAFTASIDPSTLAD